MIRVALAVRMRPLRAALEQALRRESIALVPLPASSTSVPVSRRDVDVVLMDAAEWSSPKTAKADAGDQAAVIVLAESPQAEFVATTLRNGARGVLPNDVSAVAVHAAVAAAAAGLVVLPAPQGAPSPAHDGQATGVTAREREVLALLASGLPNRAIGARLGISEHTVKTYVASLLDKLHAATRAEAVAIGLRRGLIML